MTEENLVGAVCDRLKCDMDKLESNSLEKIEVESFNLSDFWTQFGSSVQALSNEVTKIGFMCGNKPFPKFSEVSSMLQDMMQYYNVMRDLYMVLPEEVGAVVYKAVRSAMLSILAALLNIVKSFEDLSEKGAKERLTLTGTFWDACNAVESLPRDNLQATLKVINEENTLAVDAHEELITVNESDHEISINSQNCDAKIDPKPTKEQEEIQHLKNSSKELNTAKRDLKRKTDTSEPLQISSNENQTICLIKKPVSQIDYNKIKDWVRIKLAWNKNPSLSTLECEINGTSNLLQRLQNNSNDPIFKDLTKKEKEDKALQLKTKLDELLAMKHIVDTEPGIFEKITCDSDASHSKVFKKNEEKESKIPTQQNSTVSIDKKLDLPLVLPKEIIDELQSSSFVYPISVANYMEVKKWIDQQIAEKKPANLDTLQIEIADVCSRFQNIISSGNSTPSTPSTANKKNRSAKRAKLLRKLKRLLLIKQIFNSHPSQFVSPITNGPISFGSPLPVGNHLLQSFNSAVFARNQAGSSHVVENTSIFIKQITNSQSIIPDPNLNIRSYNANNEKNYNNYSYKISSKSFLLSESSESHNMPLNYETEFQRRSYQSNIDTFGRLPPVSGLCNVDGGLEEIHMVLPLPHNCSEEFMEYFLQIQISDVLSNIEKHNYGLRTDRWKIYKQWRDEFKGYNALLGMDEKSLKILEAQDYKAPATYFCYVIHAYFKKSLNMRRPVNDLSTSPSKQYSNRILSIDYQHGAK